MYSGIYTNLLDLRSPLKSEGIALELSPYFIYQARGHFLQHFILNNWVLQGEGISQDQPQLMLADRMV